MPDDAGRIEDAPLGEALSTRYLTYALSTITARSLPDVRDGLKPVHRRVLYAMHQLRLDPTGGFKKCARVVGDVIGKFHPHGEVAVYDAIVRLAQDFAQRYPLVEGSGNFGNIDGDNAAAMRYTESRLTAVAGALLDGIDNDAVDFRPNYDGEETEPVVLPGAFPNLLANGSAGIAVGMATSIPPHNAAELCAAALHLIENPGADTDALLAFVRGPDFPTGGVLAEDPAVLRAAYDIGRGSVRLRARWSVETAKGGAWTAVVTEIPYQVQKGKLIEQLAALLEEKKLTLLADIRDESDALVRIVLEPRARTVDPRAMMEQIFRLSAMETRFPYNMNVLDAQRTPRLMGLRALLRAWLDHRQDVLLRQTRHRAAGVARRAEVLDGYLAVYLNLDEVIRIIRESDEPKPELMAAFTLSDPQAEAILNMRLRALRRLEEQVIRRERKSLAAEEKALAALLASPAKQWTRIGEQVAAVRDGAGAGARRTAIAGPPADAPPEGQFVEREPLTVILSAAAWVRCVRGHLMDGADLKFKEGDTLARLLTCQSTDRITAFASNGRAYTLRAADLPRGRGDGQPLRVLIELGDAEIVALFVTDETTRYLVASTDARGFLVAGSELAAEKRTGKIILATRPGASACACVPATGDHVACAGENRKLLVFPLAQLPEMTRGQGVLLQRCKDGGLASVRVISFADGLSWPSGERTRTERDLAPWLGDRGAAGRTVPTGWPRP